MPRFCKRAAAHNGLNALPAPEKAALRRGKQRLAHAVKRGEQYIIFRNAKLGCGRWCRCAQIRHKIRNREIRLMPDCAHHRDLAFVNRLCNHLFVERPKILKAPAATANDQHVRTPDAIHLPDSLCDLLRCTHTLDSHRVKQQIHCGKPALRNADDIAYRSAALRGNDADASRQHRNRLLMRFIKQSLRLQPRFEHQEAAIQLALPLMLH